MICFICSSPFQIINAINMSLNIFNEDIKDIYILDHAPQNYSCYLELNKVNVFNKVYFIKSKNLTSGHSNIKLLRYIKTIMHFFNQKIIISQIHQNVTNYDKMFISSPDIPSQIMYYYFKKKHRLLELFMFEEGTLAYNYFNINISSLKVLFQKLLYKKDFMSEHKGGFVYRPEFINNTNKMIMKIPSIDKKSKEMMNLLNTVMSYEENYSNILSAKFIFFDQAFQFKELNDNTNEIIRVIVGIVGEKNITVKLHPRTDLYSYNSICQITNVNVPFEIISLNINTSDKVLISHSSSVCFNPKILFNEEPYVILLYKLVNDTNIPNFTAEIDILAKKIKMSYTEPHKFCIPENLEELDKILQSIIANSKQ